jgi:putative transposase
MTSTTRTQRQYDHRLRQLIRSTGDVPFAVRQGIPPSIARGWVKATPADVVSFDVVEMDKFRIEQEVLALRRRVERLVAILRLLVTLLKVSGFSLARTRVPDGTRKSSLLRIIERTRSALPLHVALRLLDLSPSRYRSWKREEECALDDSPSCPRLSPQQLTPGEVGAIKEMVTSEEFRHVPTGTLALLAQRLGKVFAAPSTWYRLVKLFQWQRPRRRVHPAKPKIGIRAARPNEIWHVDTTLIRLLDGSRADLQAVIDNFSRRILAWKVSPTFDPNGTAELLLNASKHLVGQQSALLPDGGVENFNGAVDEPVHSGLLRRLLALTEIAFSNSLIESWWRSLKHQWLYLNTLDTVAALEKLVAFDVAEHNTRLPHSAFHGQTPDEMYFDAGRDVPGRLAAGRHAARETRIETNRKRTCRICETLTTITS